MGTKIPKTFEAKTTEEWRKWLTEHHDSEAEVWLIFNKRHTGRPSIAYQDALDEALCFGWIDSLIKRLDEERYARKFTRRRADSRWSTVNRKRYAQLKDSGRLMPAGLERAPTDRSYDPPRSFPTQLPGYIKEALRRTPTASRHFEKLAPWERRRYVGWIDFAKRPETKMKRLREVIRVLAAGRKLGLK